MNNRREMREITLDDKIIDFSKLASSVNWRKDLEKRRHALRLQFNTSQYDRADLAWYHKAFLEYFLFMYDSSFYDCDNDRYRVEEILDEGKSAFGGYDIIVLWQAFARIGVDERNQFDFYRDMPGGLEGLRDLVKRAHIRGTRVFISYNPWDIGTRREAKSDAQVLAEIVEALDADGIFLDTMWAATKELREALDRVKPGIVFETEGIPSINSAELCTGSWGQGAVPSPRKVLSLKWIEPRFSIRGVDRNSANRSPLIALGFFHGMGHVLWENIFGWWNPFTLQDRVMLRRCITLLRAHEEAFLASNGDLYIGDPLIGEVSVHRWNAGEKTVYTLFNSGSVSIDGPLLVLRVEENMEIYDVWNGGKARTTPYEDDTLAVHLRIDSLGCGCLIVQPRDWRPPIVAKVERLSDKPSYYRVEPGTHLAHPVGTSEPAKLEEIPAGMTQVPRAKIAIRIDAMLGSPPGTRYSYPEYGRPSQRGDLSRQLDIESFLIDRTEVTNIQYREFLNSTGYTPRVMKNFLKHWIKPSGENSEACSWQIPPGEEKHPVVYVDLEDARAYARWAKKRLPTEEEWQYAAQGKDKRKWPWGNEYDKARCNGIDGTRGRGNDIEGSFGRTTPVDAYPDGASPFGCLDMSGNVWEWTESERDDGHTRYAILRGGCHFRAGGSLWYVSGGAQPCDRHAKMLLLYPGLDRCSTIGFRCVKDFEQ